MELVKAINVSSGMYPEFKYLDIALCDNIGTPTNNIKKENK